MKKTSSTKSIQEKTITINLEYVWHIIILLLIATSSFFLININFLSANEQINKKIRLREEKERLKKERIEQRVRAKQIKKELKEQGIN